MTTVQISLPDQLAQEAQNAGLLSPASLEKMLREQLKTRTAPKLVPVPDRPVEVESDEEISPAEDIEERVTTRVEKREKRHA